MKTLASLLRISALAILFTVLFWAYATMAQTETGTISGLITDEAGGVVAGADVQLLNVQRGTSADAKTNGAGIYVFNGVQPGQYQIKVQKPGFKQVDLLSLIVNVQDHIEQNVRLQVGSVSESVTVNANDLHINTTDGSVGTVVDRQFVENIPLNGRSFQSLITLAPGVVLTKVNVDQGQFSVNGQRANSNYFSIDGVGANIGSSPGGNPGQSDGGTLPGFSALGSTNNLVSIDAMQELKVLTSTFAPEYGRTPGAQISIATRSGTGQFHGTAFDYFRNDVLDANDWFANKAKLARPAERQNDFGGVFGGPIAKDWLFFFFSYEGLRLRLPATGITSVPGLASRQAAPAAVKPFLDAFPQPNGMELSGGFAQFSSTFSNPSTLDATSLRIDAVVNSRVRLFSRYNYAPSVSSQRGTGYALSVVEKSPIDTQTFTAGVTWLISPTVSNDFRANYSRNSGRLTFSQSQGVTWCTRKVL